MCARPAKVDRVSDATYSAGRSRSGTPVALRDDRWLSAREIRLIWSPYFGVFAVAAAGVLCAFSAWWTHYLDSVSAAGPVQVPLSLLLLELSGYCMDAVQLHVNAADVLVRRGIDWDDSR
jgi:hypothetical protein